MPLVELNGPSELLRSEIGTSESVIGVVTAISAASAEQALALEAPGARSGLAEVVEVIGYGDRRGGRRWVAGEG